MENKILFPSGTTQTFNFFIGNTLLADGNCTVRLYISEYGQTIPLITKDRNNGVTVLGEFVEVVINANDTKGFKGTYHMQVHIISGAQEQKTQKYIIYIEESLG